VREARSALRGAQSVQQQVRKKRWRAARATRSCAGKVREQRGKSRREDHDVPPPRSRPGRFPYCSWSPTTLSPAPPQVRQCCIFAMPSLSTTFPDGMSLSLRDDIRTNCRIRLSARTVIFDHHFRAAPQQARGAGDGYAAPGDEALRQKWQSAADACAQPRCALQKNKRSSARHPDSVYSGVRRGKMRTQMRRWLLYAPGERCVPGAAAPRRRGYAPPSSTRDAATRSAIFHGTRRQHAVHQTGVCICQMRQMFSAPTRMTAMRKCKGAQASVKKSAAGDTLNSFPFRVRHIAAGAATCSRQ